MKLPFQALAYAAGLTAPHVAHLHSIYTCTFGVVFSGTPHHGADRVRLLGKIQRLVSLTTPKAFIQVESSLVNALEVDSETLQNITDQFIPLMSNFRIFFWEQEKTDLKYTKDYIVEERSAAPMLANTERSGMPADHCGMCRFGDNTAVGFRTVVAALRRYCEEAPDMIRDRQLRTVKRLSDLRSEEAMELLRGVPVPVPASLPLCQPQQMMVDSRDSEVFEYAMSTNEERLQI